MHARPVAYPISPDTSAGYCELSTIDFGGSLVDPRLPMHSRVVPALLLVAACWPVYANEPTPTLALQACNEAMQSYDAALRTANAQAAADAKRQVFKDCYTGSGRAPTWQEPISIGADRKAATPPALPAPAAPAVVLPKAPSVLTNCDAGGCWDNLGNRYHGSGSILFSPAGKPCSRMGDWIDCR